MAAVDSDSSASVTRAGKAKRATSSHARATAAERGCATVVCATVMSVDTAKTARVCCALTPALATGCAYKEAFVTAILAGLGSTALCEAARLIAEVAAMPAIHMATASTAAASATSVGEVWTVCKPPVPSTARPSSAPDAGHVTSSPESASATLDGRVPVALSKRAGATTRPHARDSDLAWLQLRVGCGSVATCPDQFVCLRSQQDAVQKCWPVRK